MRLKMVRATFAMFAATLFAAMLIVPGPTDMVQAQESSVTCRSQNNSYNECRAEQLNQPELVRKLAGAQCVEEQTWGYNPRTGYIWVSQGCSGVFADAADDTQDGCHGAGCLVDNPDQPSGVDLSQDGIERCASAAVAKARSMGHNPRIRRIIDQYPDDDGYHVEGEVMLTRSDGNFAMHFLCVWDGNRANVLLGSGL